MKPQKQTPSWMYALGIVPAVWLALLVAPSISGGLQGVVAYLPQAMNHPFQIMWCEDSFRTVLLFLAAYGLGVGIFLSTRHPYRRGEEHGSAQWGDSGRVNHRYADKVFSENKLFTQHVRMGLDTHKRRRNLNTVVIGGSGAGKTRFYAKPNLCQANTSFVILDPKGELLRDTGHLLEKKGYEVRVLDLLNKIGRAHV